MRGKIPRFLCCTLFVSLTLTMSAYCSDELEVGNLSANLFAEGQTSVLSSGTSLGYVSADAVAYVTGANIVLLAGGDFGGNLQAGMVTAEDIERVFPEDQQIMVAQMTAMEISSILEAGASQFVYDLSSETIDRESSKYGGFPQISGLNIVYDVSAPAGERLYSAELSDGSTLDVEDTQTRYTVAMTEKSMEGAYGWPTTAEYSRTGKTLREALADYIRDYGEQIEDPIKEFTLVENSQRIETIGSNDSTITAGMPRGTLALVVLLVIIVIGIYRSKDLRQAREASKRALD